MAKGKGEDSRRMHHEYAVTGKVEGVGSIYKGGRPAKYAKGGVVEGVSQRKGIAMGGEHVSKTNVSLNSKGGFQRKK